MSVQVPVGQYQCSGVKVTESLVTRLHREIPTLTVWPTCLLITFRVAEQRRWVLYAGRTTLEITTFTGGRDKGDIPLKYTCTLAALLS